MPEGDAATRTMAESDSGDDWLESSGGEDGPSASQRMAERDLGKVQRKMYDEGYREGIAAGKEAAIQPGFDVGIERGASIGRQLGQLRGTLYALERLLAARLEQGTGKTDVQHPSLASLDALRSSVGDLSRQADAFQLTDLVEPDWEAIEHEREHDGGHTGSLPRETAAERASREARVPSLQAEADRLLNDYVARQTSL